MFVQSHIQRHHHHHHNNQHSNHNHHQHNHQHHHQHQHQHQHHHHQQQHHHLNHSSLPNQQSFGHHKQQQHHNALGDPISHKRSAVSSSSVNSLACRLTKSSAAIAGLAFVLGTSEREAAAAATSSSSHHQVDGGSDYQIIPTISGDAPLVNKQSGSKLQTDHQKNQTHENKSNFKQREPTTTSPIENGIVYKAPAKRGRDADKRLMLRGSSFGGRQEKAAELNLDISVDEWQLERTENSPFDREGRQFYRKRTKSLGSHRSLTAYDYMPRNPEVARVGTATIGAPLESYCKPIYSTIDARPTVPLGGVEAEIGPDYFFSGAPHKLHTSDIKLRRAHSEVGSKSNLGRLLVGSQKLLFVILAKPLLIAHKLSSSLQYQPSLFDNPNTSSNNNRPSQAAELLRSFCISFISYQFETWRLLANDLAKEKEYSANRSASICCSMNSTKLHYRAISSDQGVRVLKEEPKHGAHDERLIVRSATVATIDPPLRGRRVQSLNRPTLERQREVVSDDDDAGVEPVIKVPKGYPPELPANSGQLTAFHQHKHNHNIHRHHHHHHHHNPDQQFKSIEIAPLQVRPLTIQSFDHPNGPQQQHGVDYRHTGGELIRYQRECCSDERDAFDNLLKQQTPVSDQNLDTRAKFYLGQHSLDCYDRLRATSFGGFLTRQNNNNNISYAEPLLEQEDIVVQQFSRDTGFWTDRPFRSEDFRTSSSCYLEATKSDDGTNSKSTEGNCDHDGSQKNLSSEGSSSRKKRSIKKSSSPLSFDGARRRLGLKRKDDSNQLLSSISVIRSEEVIPSEVKHLSRQTTFNSLYDSGTESGSFWRGQPQFLPDPRANFVEGLGSGQMASRQALVSPYLGDIQLSLSSRRGMLEVEVIRARGLHSKTGAKSVPSPYVKVYLMKGKKCIAKCRTHQVKQTLDPLYQEPFVFRNEFKSCILQVIVWGDYGKRDRKSMMGIVQIHLDDLDISNMVIGWYKLFNTISMTNSLVSSKTLRQKLLHSTSISESPLMKS